MIVIIVDNVPFFRINVAVIDCISKQHKMISKLTPIRDCHVSTQKLGQIGLHAFYKMMIMIRLPNLC